jgi:glycosyl transferase family 2
VKLSVVMAVHDGERYLREAIESVLAQSFTDFEFVIVDDASTDNTRGILAEYQRLDSRICVLHNKSNLGPYASVNQALMRAQGHIIARHDADDISPPGRFTVQLEALEPDAEISLVTGAVELFGTGSGQAAYISRPPSWQPKLEWELLFTNVVGAGSHVMFPRVFQGTPVLFPAKHRYAEDYGLWCRLSRLGRVACPGQVIYRYRQHALSVTSRNRAEQQACLTEIRQLYQSLYLTSEEFREMSVELSRFWLAHGSQRLGGSVRGITALLTELRTGFLRDIEQRYGHSQRLTIEVEIDRTFSERLAYWLFRSARFLDRKAIHDLLSIASDRGETVKVSARALALLLRAIVVKERQSQP